MAIDERLLAVLSCPACQGDLKQEKEKIVCCQCNRKYPVKNGIPVLLVEEAQQ